MCKRMISGLLVLLLTIGFSIPAFAAGQGRTVRVGFFEMEGFFEKDKDGNYSGYGYDYVVEMAKYEGWTLEFVEGDFDALQYQMVDDKTVDLMLGLYYYDEYDAHFSYSNLSIGVGSSLLTTRADNTALSFEDYEGLNGKRIGFLSDRYKCDEFQLLAQQKRFSYAEVMYQTSDKLYRALADGDVDAIVANDVFVSEGEKLIVRFSYQNYYVVTPKASPLMTEINDALAHIYMNYPQFQAELYQKHYILADDGTKKIGLADYLTAAEKAYVSTSRPLVVGISKYIMTEEETGLDSCMAASVREMYQDIATQTGLQFRFTTVNDVAEAISQANSGEIDIIGVFPEKASFAEENNIVLSNSFLTVHFDGVCNKNKTVGENPTLSMRRGLYYNSIICEKHQGASILYADSYHDMVEAVNDGRAELAIINRYIAEELLASTDFNNVYSVSTAFSENVACGISKNSDPLLISMMNKGIACVSAEEMAAIVEKNRTLYLSEPTIASFISTHPLFSIIFIAVFVTVIALSILALCRQHTTKRDRKTKDLLTGLDNTNGFLQDGQKLLDANPCTAFVLSCFDIRHFSYITSVFGLERSNLMLQFIGKTLQNALAGKCLVARGEGNHFIVLYECLNADNANTFADKLQEKLNEYEHARTENYAIQIFSGSVMIPIARPKLTLRELLEQALIAQETIQTKSVRNAFFQPEMVQGEAKKRQLLKQFGDAIDRNEFHIFLQPVHALDAHETLIGAELLTRWIKPDNALLYPDEFINSLVSCNAIIRFDTYVLSQACAFIQEHREASWMEDFNLSVNISNTSALQPDFVERCALQKQQYGIPDNKITLEFSERVVFESPKQFVALFAALRNVGFRCAIDNLGSGNASLRLLGTLGADAVKLDRTLFCAEDTRTEQRNDLLVSGILQLAKACALTTTAIGIDRMSQLRYLKENGCDGVQGYIFAKPMDIRRFLAYATDASSQEKMAAAG